MGLDRVVPELRHVASIRDDDSIQDDLT
jgi:hypothetical protein